MPKVMIGATAYLLLEIALFILVGRWLGVSVTLLLVLASSGLGIFLMRTQGMQSAYRTLEQMQRGSMAGHDNMPDVVLIFAGFLLFLPGFLTDALGLLLWLSPLRHFIKQRAMRGFMRANVQQPASDASAEGPCTIEGEFERRDSD